MSKSRSSFKKDLKRGTKVEDFVLQKIKNKYPEAKRISGYCKEYDIWIPEINQGIEVKYDPKSNETGNIVIEIEMGGKPSALSTTKASQWIFYDGKRLVSIEPRAIKECIYINQLQLVSFTGPGDEKSKRAYLVPKDTLFKYGKEIYHE